MLGTLEGGFGADCGILRIGETVEIDVTSYFQDGFAASNPDQEIAAGVGTNGTSLAAFRDVEFLVSGNFNISEGPVPFTGRAAIWGAATNGTFGSADTVTYTATNPSVAIPSENFETLDFQFTELGQGVFVGESASISQLGLTDITKAVLKATLVGGVNTENPTIVGFGLEPRIPGVIPVDGTTIGGFVTTEVPGPLPIAGTGAAFVWSRKLRRKLKLAASSRSTN